MSSRAITGSVAALVLIGAAILGYVLLAAEPVEVVPATKRTIVESLVATGQVQPRARVDVASQVAGRVVEIHFEEGDEVATGAVLVRLDDDEARADRAQAQARVDAARARLRSVTERGAPTAAQDLRKANVAYEGALEELERGRQLRDAGVITGARVDELERQAEQAAAELDQAQTRAEQASADGSDYAEAAAGLRQARAARQLAAARLKEHTVRAPRDGTMLARNVELGASVQPGQPLAVLAADGPVELRLDPDERELAALDVGQRAVVAADAFEDRPFEAVIDRIAPAVDRERGTIGVYLLVNDPPAFLRPDMTASVEIIVGRRAEALVVPRSAVRQLGADDPFVLVVEESRARRRGVSTGLVGSGLVEIRDGLEIAEEVIVDVDVGAGDRVRVSAIGAIDDFEAADSDDGAPFDMEVPQAL